MQGHEVALQQLWLVGGEPLPLDDPTLLIQLPQASTDSLASAGGIPIEADGFIVEVIPETPPADLRVLLVTAIDRTIFLHMGTMLSTAFSPGFQGVTSCHVFRM